MPSAQAPGQGKAHGKGGDAQRESGQRRPVQVGQPKGAGGEDSGASGEPSPPSVTGEAAVGEREGDLGGGAGQHPDGSSPGEACPVVGGQEERNATGPDVNGSATSQPPTW